MRAILTGFGTVHMLPLVGTFIAFVLVTGALLPAVRLYAALYLVGGLMIAGASGFLVTISPSTPDSQIMGVTALLGAGIGIAFPIGVSVNSYVLPKEFRPDVAMLNSLSLSIPSALTLSVAGCIYQNLSFRDLKDVLEPFGFSEIDIREALAGASSKLSTGSGPQIRSVVAATVTRVIAKEFYISIAAGAIIIVTSAFMKWEALDFNGTKTIEAAKSADVLVSAGEKV